jgi:hypothetical protein
MPLDLLLFLRLETATGIPVKVKIVIIRPGLKGVNTNPFWQ